MLSRPTTKPATTTWSLAKSKTLSSAIFGVIFISLFLSDPALGDTVIGSGGNNILIDNQGRRWPAQVGYTTNGSGDIFTLDGLLASDNIIGDAFSGNRLLVDNLTRRWNASVLYTTDGSGNVIPISGGGGGVTSVTASSPLFSSGGASPNLTLQSSDATHNGYLSSVNWSTFNSKEPAISAGTTSQYWRGDKSFQALDTSVVPENGSLYYTDTRVQTAAKNGTSAQSLYVSKDVGNDSFDGSILHPYKTIGAAITAANSIAAYYKQVIIHIAPAQGSAGSSYNENLTLSQQGVTLQCENPVQSSRACLVTGTLTVNLTGTSGGVNFIAASNDVYVNGIQFSSGASSAISFSGSVFQRLVLSGCYIQAGAAMAVNETNTGVNSEIRSYDTTFENNSATIPTVTLTAGRFWLYGTVPTVQNNNASGPSFIQNGPSSMIANLTQFVGQYQLTDNTATASFNLSTIASGTASCLSTPSSPNTGYAILASFGCNSSNTNSITGSGVVINSPNSVRFGSSGDIVSTVTQTSIGPGLPQGEILLGPGATTGTNVLLSVQGGHVKVHQSTAPTASPGAAAGTSSTCTLSNASDSSGIITLTNGTASFAAGTQCTVTFNKAYGIAPNCVVTPNNRNAANDSAAHQIDFTTTTTTLLVDFGVQQNVASTQYKWMYHCEEP